MKITRLLTILGVLLLSLALVGAALAAANAASINNDPPDLQKNLDTLSNRAGPAVALPLPTQNPTWQCPSPAGEVVEAPESPVWEPAWDKWVNGTPWSSGMSVTVETSGTLEVKDQITTYSHQSIMLVDRWDPTRLTLLDFQVLPPDVGPVVQSAGTLTWYLPDNSHPMTITKHFRIEPSTWLDTLLSEELRNPCGLFGQKPFEIHKLPPDLWIDSTYDPEVLAGEPASFTLTYGNQGGYENDTKIRNEFPPEAPFVSSDPPPSRSAPDASWAEWDTGDLPMNSQGSINVTVAISSSLEPSTTVKISDWIYNHIGDPADMVTTTFHVKKPPFEWDKWVDGVSWTPKISVTVETSDTIQVIDVISTSHGFSLKERWNPEELHLVGWSLVPSVGTVTAGEDSLEWQVLQPSGAMTFTKFLQVEPSDWTETVLQEALWHGDQELEGRPVTFYKLPPGLWISSTYEPEVLAGDVATFSLQYGNQGGYENDTWIRNEFPPEALFVSSVPAPDRLAPDHTWAEWDTGDLPMGSQDEIQVTTAISNNLPVSTTIEVWDGIYNHLDSLADETVITYHVHEPPQQEGDIYIKDNSDDDGSVASNVPWWVSPDIWVRHTDDGGLEYQNPLPGQTNYIYVRVRNRGATTITDISVDVYWGSAALGLSWPTSLSPAGSAHISSMAPGDITVVSIPWATPNIGGHFCLVARLDSPDDPIGSGPDTISPTNYVYNNNNIAQRNTNVVDYPEITQCGFYTTTVATDVVHLDVVNPRNVTTIVDLEFSSADFPLALGEISVDPGGLSGRWSSLTNFNQVGAQLAITGFPAKISGIQMAPGEIVRVTMTITAEIDKRFIIDVQEQADNRVVGGIRYMRNLPDCVFLPILFDNGGLPPNPGVNVYSPLLEPRIKPTYDKIFR